ncbi:hypothetical protein BGX29_002995, partial [Mortierella sp. GBA35]
DTPMMLAETPVKYCTSILSPINGSTKPQSTIQLSRLPPCRLRHHRVLSSPTSKRRIQQTAAIGGSIAAAVVLRAIIGILAITRRRRSRNNPSTNTNISTTSIDYPFGEQKQFYINAPSRLVPNKNPQWNSPDDNHNTIDSHSATVNDPQGAS